MRAPSAANLDALLAPLVRADQAEHLTQRHHRRLRRAARTLPRRRRCTSGARRSGIAYCSSSGSSSIASVRARCDCASRCRLKVSIGEGGGVSSAFFFAFFGLCFDTARDRLQQLARVLEIAAPQDRRAFARQAIGRIGGHLVVADHDALRRRVAAFRAPARRAAFAVFLPMNLLRTGDGAGAVAGLHVN